MDAAPAALLNALAQHPLFAIVSQSLLPEPPSLHQPVTPNVSLLERQLDPQDQAGQYLLTVLKYLELERHVEQLMGREARLRIEDVLSQAQDSGGNRGMEGPEEMKESH